MVGCQLLSANCLLNHMAGVFQDTRMACDQQALANLYSDNRCGSDGVRLPARQQPPEMTSAAVSAYTAGIKPLLAHEAALHRGLAAIRCNAIGSAT